MRIITLVGAHQTAPIQPGQWEAERDSSMGLVWGQANLSAGLPDRRDDLEGAAHHGLGDSKTQRQRAFFDVSKYPVTPCHAPQGDGG